MKTKNCVFQTTLINPLILNYVIIVKKGGSLNIINLIMCLYGLAMLAELIVATGNYITQLTIITDPYADCIRHLQYTINILPCPYLSNTFKNINIILMVAEMPKPKLQ